MLLVDLKFFPPLQLPKSSRCLHNTNKIFGKLLRIIGGKLKKKIIILCNSHDRNISKIISEHIGTEYEVIGIVQPGASIEKIAKSAKQVAKI